jgi:hypothetical protein
MDFELNREQREIQKAVREFVKSLSPTAGRWPASITSCARQIQTLRPAIGE